MIEEWFKLSDERRKEIFTQTASKYGLPSPAIEKDWWVTLVLTTTFELDFSEHLAFKGGTSLSKGWNLIQRFSEDIDLVIDMYYLGFDGNPKPQNITKLRKTSHKFVRDDLCKALDEALNKKGALGFEISPQEELNTSTDPHSIIISYKSVTETSQYVSPQVKLEVGGRSLMEPSREIKIQSLVGKQFSGKPFADEPMQINTIEPKRTFLEKAFLLHEEFQKEVSDIRTERMTRHLYDLEKLMDTEHGKEALSDKALYSEIVNHRKVFSKLPEIDYDSHFSRNIDFLPPENVIDDYKRDYAAMQESMIYGESLSWDSLLDRIKTLKIRFKRRNTKNSSLRFWYFIISGFNYKL